MYPSGFTALYDACVLYPAPLRDFLVQLALTDLFDDYLETLLQQGLNISVSMLREIYN